ncbi:hypothetical protein CC86DRAFT_446724 [Ophiobolus disseminans]|uniref:Cora-domain-containing protein n=1 Tax=Ophiobolus disseminans TaxID=1469910 RepID=A0A6A6ZX06_9PLEO|nr:hypothetical protein CC86DRAFT_446724 [Ophiobolus disseminans]
MQRKDTLHSFDLGLQEAGVDNELVEDLGTKLDIDPWFFASYIYQAWRNTKTQSTQNCTIPSRERKQNFLALHYHRTLSFGTLDAQYVQLRRRSHHERKVFVIPAMSGERVGLAQHCCSILLVERPNQSWVCIILTDPEMDHQYTPGRNFGRLPVKIPSTPFLGGCEAFQTSNEREYDLKGQSGATKRGMLEDLVQYWTVSAPSMFDPCNPTLRAMAYYPLKIVAAEWVNYIAVMAFSLKAYELSMKPSSNLSDELIKLNFNLRNLQTWRRRVLSTQGKLRQAVRFIYRRQAVNGASENWDALWEDYQFIIAEIDNHGQRLEAMIPVVTSAVQLVESRRSLIATTNVSRLTVLALIFIPLTYVASIFSMSEQFGPGGSKFWVYFTVSVPITAIVVGIANPPKWVAEFVARRAVKDA